MAVKKDKGDNFMFTDKTVGKGKPKTTAAKNAGKALAKQFPKGGKKK